jgi:drug efflux transport system permease protein
VRVRRLESEKGEKGRKGIMDFTNQQINKKELKTSNQKLIKMKFRTFWAFVKKEYFHILRDRRTLLILFGMPVVQVIIFGYAITNEFKDASIAVLDNSKDYLSTELVQHLSSSGHFKVVADLQNYDEMHDYFAKGEIKMAVVIPSDFANKFYDDKNAQIQLIADGTEPNYATTLVSYATPMVMAFQQRKSELQDIPFRINILTRMIYNPELKSVYNFVPGVVALILMLISAMMTALTIAKEKEMGTMELLLVSPLPPMLIIVGKVTPYVLLSFINAVIILLLSVFVFEMPIVGNLMLLMGVCILFVLTSLSIGIFISTKAESQQTAMLVSLMALMMPTMLLSGFVFPIESMPFVLQVISSVIPATYFIDILKNIMLKGTGWEFIWYATSVLAGMTLFFLMVSWKNFKIRIE